MRRQLDDLIVEYEYNSGEPETRDSPGSPDELIITKAWREVEPTQQMESDLAKALEEEAWNM